MKWLEKLETWLLTEGPASFRALAVMTVAYGFFSGMVDAAEVQSFRGYLVVIPFTGLGILLYLVGRALARRSAVAVPLMWAACAFFILWMIRTLPLPGQTEPFLLAVEYGLVTVPFAVVILVAWVALRLWRHGALDGGFS